MSSCRLLCLLLLPFLAVTATDDIEEEYGSQSKSDSKMLADHLSMPLDDLNTARDRPLLPGQWAALFQRQSAQSAQEWPESQESDSGNPSKRVFCNGFTGCGGRFRGRRRQPKPALGKRPFCNYHGCSWTGKRSGVPNREFAQKIMRLPPAIRKRLFCNAFDGCRGLKRALYSNWLSKLQGIAGDLPAATA